MMDFKGRNKRFPCGFCRVQCQTKFANSCVKCCMCKQWYHTRCQGLEGKEIERWADFSMEYLCITCRTIGDGEFDYVLGMHRLEKAALTKNINQLREAVQREMMFDVGLQLPEEPMFEFPSVDPDAAHVIDNFVDDITGNPRRTSGDGDCLFNAVSILLHGNEALSAKLRYHTCLSLVSNMDRYMKHPLRPRIQNLSCSYESACLASAKIGAFSSSWTIIALSDVIGMSIRVVYPYANGRNDVAHQSLNTIFSHEQNNERELVVLWHKLGAIPLQDEWYDVNHFSAVTDAESVLSEHTKNSSTPINSRTEKTTFPKAPEESIIDEKSPDGIPCKKRRVSENVSVNVSTENRFSVLSDTSDMEDEMEIDVDESSGDEKHVNGECKLNKGKTPLPDGKPLSPTEILNIIISDTPTVDKIPTGLKENIYSLLDNSENLEKIKLKKAPKYWDDCGAWDSKKARSIKTKFLLGDREADGGHRLSHIIIKDDLVHIEARQNGVKTLQELNPQPDKDSIVTFHRYYAALKRKPDYKRRVTWVEGLPHSIPGIRDVAVIEYTGEFDNSPSYHGNSKLSTEAYERTDPAVISKMKDKLKHQKASDVYAQMTDPDLNTTADHPRDLKQCQNFKAAVNRDKRGYQNSNNVADELLNVLKMINDGHPYVAEINHSRNNPLPSIICYTEEQITDFKSFLSTRNGVVGIDRTFSLGKCFVTTTVYKSHKVVRKSSGEPPILIGPVLLHWDGKQETYFRFFSHLRGILGIEFSNLEILMGTDDEKAMTNAIDLAFPGVNRRLCTKHIKDNLLRQMTDKIPKSTSDRNEIINLIFGANGVAKANDSSIFDERNNALKETLKKKHHEDFLNYYESFVQEKIENHVVAKSDDLWTNNNTESINHRLKVLLGWEPKKTDELVLKLFDLVKVQMVDMRRALYGTGNFSLCGAFQKMKITKLVWASKSEFEKHKLLQKFLKAGKLTSDNMHVTSTDGTYSVRKDPRLAKKPNQKTRCRPHKTTRN